LDFIPPFDAAVNRPVGAGEKRHGWHGVDFGFIPPCGVAVNAVLEAW